MNPMIPDDAPYAGLRVLDVSQGIAGPYCGLMLAQMGASVTKVEPAEGDWGRSMGLAHDGFSAIALAFNAGKRSIALDARAADGQALLRDLAARADVLIQSFRPGVIERLGLGYAGLAEVNPALVYVSISGFGADGPYAERPGTDSVVQALSGLMVLNADEQGNPQRIKPFMGDLACGMYAANAVGAALYAAQRRGAGRQVQVSLIATLAALQNSSIIDHRLRAGAPATAVTYPQGVFRTRNGHVLVFAMNNAMFEAVCRVVGREDWLRDPRMRTPQARIRVGDEINEGVARALREDTTEAWVARFRANDTLYGEVKDYEQFLDDEQVRQQGIFQALERRGLPAVPFAGLPGAGTASPPPPAPTIGEHSMDILRGLDYPEARIRELLQAGVVTQAQSPSEQPSA